MSTPAQAKKRPIPFGKYLLLDRVNIGGMAEVWRGKTFGVGGVERLVAIKRILPNIAEDEEFIAMFIDEAKITVQLTHAHVAQIYELGRIGSSYFIAMEYLPSKDMRAIFDRCRKRGEIAPIALSCYAISKICEGLDYAHRKKDNLGRDMNIVHRDVSPQNLLVSYEGEVKVIDFGIAKAVGKASKTQAGILKGKFGYMSPEQVRGQAVDRRSDIFAVGICLYEMLSGERLFVGDSDFSVLEQVRKAEVLPPSSHNGAVPPALDKIVLKALARDVGDRYQFAHEVADDLQRFLITSESLFGRKDLVQFMKTTFAEEVEREQVRLQEYLDIPLQEYGLSASDSQLLAGESLAVATEDQTRADPIPEASDDQTRADAYPGTPPAPALTGPTPEEFLPKLTVAVPALHPIEESPQPTRLLEVVSGLSSLSSTGVDSPEPAALGGAEEAPPTRTDVAVPHPSPPGRVLPAVPKTPVLYGAGALLAVVLAFFAGHATSRAPATGLLMLELPPGFTASLKVNVNGEWVRGPDGAAPTWPLLHKAPAGKVSVLATADGYLPFKKSVEVVEGREVTPLQLALTPVVQTQPLVGALEVPGAEVRLDGALLHVEDGVLFDRITTGEPHLLEVTAPGYKPWRRQLAPDAGRKPLSVTPRLEAYEFKAHVSSSPSGATILNGEIDLGKTPKNLLLSPAVKSLQLQKRCYESVTLLVKLSDEPREPLQISQTLRRSPNCR